ncbi:MAG TPA: isoaspartyl peptidase/L-asparaginase, partial [Lacibacter sp.]|nr:isoaspartyl peptidase/L-asparaginase [Lacibacter sp.]
MGDFSIAIHGGAGTILKKDLTPELEAAYTKGLADAVASGYKILSNGGTAIDAVTAAVISLEDCILFNAGKG